MALPSSIIYRDTRANQPAATAVAAGTIYFVTDETVLERSNGAAWQSYSGAGVASPVTVAQGGTGATTLTGILKGNGTSAFTAITIPSDSTKFLDGSATPVYDTVKDSDLVTSDITTNNVDNTKHGFAPKNPNDATKYLSGTGVYSVPAGTTPSEWTTTTVQLADQDVTNSAVAVNGTDLKIAVNSGEAWLFQLLLLYSGSSTTGDFRLKFIYPSTCTELHNWSNFDATLTGTGNIGLGNVAATGFASVISLGTDAADTIFVCLLNMILIASGTGDVQMQFAQNIATVGTHARLKAGSIFRGKKII
jgi:hypothetical protein